MSKLVNTKENSEKIALHCVFCGKKWISVPKKEILLDTLPNVCDQCFDEEVWQE